MNDAAELECLAALVSYPRQNYHEVLAKAAGAQDAPAALQRFTIEAVPLSVRALQERYTETFDLNPACALEIGWHLFGENYDRGRFLVRMRQELRRHAIPESTELPDHLGNVLRLLARLDAAAAEDFAVACVRPALAKMLPLLPAENCFRLLLEAVFQVVATRFPASPQPVEPLRLLPVLG